MQVAIRRRIGAARVTPAAAPARIGPERAGRAVDHDVIGSEPDRAPRRRPAVRTVRLPDRLRRHRRTLVALAAVVAVVGVVTVLRAGITGLKPEQGPGAPVAGAQRKPPLAGSVITLVSGQNTLYALAADSAAGSRPSLLASENDGGHLVDADAARDAVRPVRGHRLAAHRDRGRGVARDRERRRGHDLRRRRGHPVRDPADRPAGGLGPGAGRPGGDGPDLPGAAMPDAAAGLSGAEDRRAWPVAGPAADHAARARRGRRPALGRRHRPGHAPVRGRGQHGRRRQLDDRVAAGGVHRPEAGGAGAAGTRAEHRVADARQAGPARRARGDRPLGGSDPGRRRPPRTRSGRRTRSTRSPGRSA